MGLKVEVKSTTTAKGKEVPKTATAPVVLTQTQALVNEMVQLEQDFIANDVHEKLKRFEEIKKHLAAVAKDMNADETAVFKGTLGEVEFSKPSMTTEIVDKTALIAALGQDTFNAVAKVGITEARKYLSEIELAPIAQKVAGSRKLNGVKPYSPIVKEAKDEHK